MLRRLRAMRDEEAGVALILVIGFMVIVTGLILVAGNVAIRSLKSSHTHVSFQTALRGAEDGIEKGLARVQLAYNTDGADYVSPSPASALDPSPDCNSAVIGFPSLTGSPSTYEQQERAWARTKLRALAAVSGCRHHTSQGDFVFMKPS